MFYIKKIRITTENSESSVVLTPGVNIIYGPSNTGKSLVLNCIDYMLGAKEHRFDAKLEIKNIELQIETKKGNASISRDVGTQDFKVISHINGIDTGSYKCSHSSKNSINDVWLKIMEIPPTKIFSTKEGKTQTLTIRTFYHTFLIDEDRIQGTSSILRGKKGMGGEVGTPILTALLYLGTGNNYLPKNMPMDPKMKKIKKESTLTFIDRSMGYLEDQKKEYNKRKPQTDPGILRQMIEQRIDEIGAAKGALEKVLNLSRQIGDKINKVNKQLSEDEMLLERNKVLLSQYHSDIKRLTFIVEGNIAADNDEQPEKCPFCDSAIPPRPKIDCIDAAIEEEKRIKSQVKDLQSVQTSLQEEHLELEQKRSQLIAERAQYEEKIRGELKPQIERLKEELNTYQSALKYAEMNEMIENFSGYLRNERTVVENDEIEKIGIDAREKFKEVFQHCLEKEFDELLRKCSYLDYVDSRFDFDSFDIVVNGHTKKSQGKGYRAFLNTILAVAIQNCLQKMGYYHPSLFIADSPILSLKEKESDEKGGMVTGPMKSSLFRYFLERGSSSQTIIIENEIPDIDYENANLIFFSKDETKGRYGLITGYKD